MWSDTLKRLRNMLSDPDGNIWTDGFLLRTWNDSQREMSQYCNVLENVVDIRVPPSYGMSYTHPWEYGFADTKSFKALTYYDQSDITLCYRWEMQNQGINTGYSNDDGYHFTHPWEGFLSLTIADIPPVWFPVDFVKAKYIAWDEKELYFDTLKNIQSCDTSYKLQTGDPISYYRIDEESNEFYLYPKPSTPEWDDITNNSEYGQVLFDENTPNQEYGTILDITGFLSNSDFGITTDAVKSGNNIFLIYEPSAAELVMDNDESAYPKWVQKYIDYGALKRAYKANNDGANKGMSDYWAWREMLGYEVIKRYKVKRRADRDYRLTSQAGGLRNRRSPKLPSTYPAVYP